MVDAFINVTFQLWLEDALFLTLIKQYISAKPWLLELGLQLSQDLASHKSDNAKDCIKNKKSGIQISIINKNYDEYNIWNAFSEGLECPEGSPLLDTTSVVFVESLCLFKEALKM